MSTSRNKIVFTHGSCFEPNTRRPIWNKASRALLFTLTSASFLASPSRGEPSPREDYGDLSLEELLNETVTSVSRHEQKLADAPAAASVLSNDAIRRSGATSIPDALRLVPGLNVAAVNSRESAISARGYNGVFSTKLLVLVDGRAVYTPLFAGVLWDLQQTPLEDVDRIEVIRGPGATVWGANAVNGVINIVSRSARDTQGGWVYAGGGNIDQEMAGVRYGGKVGENTYYRVFGTHQSNSDFRTASGASGEDSWRAQHGGFRVDHYSDVNTQLTWQADATRVKFYNGESKGNNLNTLGRWTRRLTDDSSVEVQAYYDRTSHNEIARAHARFNTTDVNLQHNFRLGTRNDLTWGLGYRYISTTIRQTNPIVQVRHGNIKQQLYSAFVQDELHLVPDKLTLTGGVKFEHNDYTGEEIQPSARLVFKPAANQTVWSAVSRAVRTPDQVESMDAFGVTLGAPFVGPDGGLYLPTATGNANPRSEVLWAYEVGYRIQPSKNVSVDLATFYHDYSRLITYGDVQRFVPGAPVGIAETPAANLFDGHSYGGEASITVSPATMLRLTASYAYVVQKVNGPARASREQLQTPPRHQGTLRASYDLSRKVSTDGQVRYVGAVEGVRSYVALDLRLAYRPSERLELALVGQNLTDNRHPEQVAATLTKVSEVPRSFYGKLTFRF